MDSFCQSETARGSTACMQRNSTMYLCKSHPLSYRVRTEYAQAGCGCLLPKQEAEMDKDG
jgi:hypothetical protein